MGGTVPRFANFWIRPWRDNSQMDEYLMLWPGSADA